MIPAIIFIHCPSRVETGTYRIAALGDCGNNSINQRNVRDQLLHYLGPDYLNAWILLGDNTYPDGTDAEFQANFFNIYKDNLLKKYPLFPSPGNHDYHDIEFSAAVSTANTRTRLLSEFQCTGIRRVRRCTFNTHLNIIPLISEIFIFYPSTLMVKRITKDCQILPDRRLNGSKRIWKKRPEQNGSLPTGIIRLYTMGSHNSDTEKELADIRENFIPVLERYGVDIVLAGHSHDYERTRLCMAIMEMTVPSIAAIQCKCKVREGRQYYAYGRLCQKSFERKGNRLCCERISG